MKGAIGNTMVMNIVITFVILTIAFLVGSISYSKAYKVKTKIVDIIEKYDGNFNDSGASIVNEISDFLGSIGYRTVSQTQKVDCKKYEEKSDDKVIGTTLNYDVCIIARNNGNSTGTKAEHYKVVVYMYFDFPVIGDAIKIPVSGETKSLFKPIS